MKRSYINALLPLALSAVLSSAAAAGMAKQSQGGAVSLAQFERQAVGLRQGMTPEEVEKLLGRPKRTALRNSGGGRESSQGNLEWTYAWRNASDSERSLQVVFMNKTPDQWLVNTWGWSGY
jgi:hypothetical protein